MDNEKIDDLKIDIDNNEEIDNETINKDELGDFFKHLENNLFKYENQQFPEYFRNSYLAGENIQYQKNTTETKKFDDEWIVTLESYFSSIDRITRNPRSFIKYDDEVVDIERAKKINSKSVRHLASHSQYVRDIKDGEVTPSKILTSYSDTDYDTYENRFLATLIQRMFLFVRNRLEVIKANVESFQKDHFKVLSKFNLANQDVEMKLDILVKRDLDNKSINEHNLNLLSRVEKLSVLIDGLKGSQFMQMMKKSKPVRPPIMKTNIILKNADFKNAYTLWLFMDKYSTLGYDTEIGEKDLAFDPGFSSYVDELMLVNYVTVISNQLQRQKEYALNDYEKFVRKRKKNPKKDFEPKEDIGDSIQIEDNILNEYFLTKYKKIFDKTVEEMSRDGEVRYDDAIRSAIRKATDIVNGIFESVFRLDEENDIFRKLVSKDDAVVKKNQLKYAKIIREVKEVDYNKAVRVEKRLIKELEKINSTYIKEKLKEKVSCKNALELSELENSISNLRKENQEYKKRINEITSIELIKKQEKENLEKIRKELQEKAKVELKLYEEKLKKEEKEQKQKLKNAYKKQLKEIEKNKIELEKAKAKNLELITKVLEEEVINNTKQLEADLEKLDKKYLIKTKKPKKVIDEQKEKERLALKKVKEYEKRIEGQTSIKKKR